MESKAFERALVTEGRAASIPPEEDLYGWLVGSWDLDIVRYRHDVSGHGLEGEAHFARVLEGRDIQDVWIMPTRTVDARLDLVDSYGTTLRVYDPAIGAWRVTWINAVTGARDELVGRRSGDRIVQVGRHGDGTPIRWIFSASSGDTFRWTGEALAADGEQWNPEAEFHARRRKG